jgi:folate-binding protein YgfZ
VDPTFVYCELRDAALIGVSGSDAAAFLQAQLTSDVAGIRGECIQYSGYCSPKGRLLATLIVWRTTDEFLLQLPKGSASAIRARLAKYVLRSRVTLGDASERFRLFGIAAPQGETLAASLVGAAPGNDRDVTSGDGLALARLSSRRSLLLASEAGVRVLGDSSGAPTLETEEWARMDIEDGVPWITPDTEERFVPQMVNLDLLGGVSFGKGCYPGQEIVARMHYLGRLKQRMYRLSLPAGPPAPRVGDPLFSARFGADQACGTLINVAPAAGGTHAALAVIQIESAREGAVHWKDSSGPLVDFLPLPYPLPE